MLKGGHSSLDRYQRHVFGVSGLPLKYLKTVGKYVETITYKNKMDTGIFL